MGPARIHPAFNMHPNFLSLAGFVLTLCHLVYLVTLMKVKINHVCTENRCPSWFPPFQLWCGWVCCCGIKGTVVPQEGAGGDAVMWAELLSTVLWGC